MLYHGRECYRRNAYMISYNFYKNIIYSMPLICVGWFSGWSGQTIYDIYLLQVYNVFFTCFPIIIYAVYDQEFCKSDLLRYPQLYLRGITDNVLSWSKYLNAIFEAMLHGLLVFAIAYVYFESALGDNGMTNDMRSDGNLCYASVIIAVTFKILFDSNTINVLVVLSSLLSVSAYFLFVYLMGLFPELDIYDQLREFAHFKQVYLVMFFIGFAAMPFVKFYQNLQLLVFRADERKQMFVDDTNDVSSSAQRDSFAEKSSIANRLAGSQASSNQVLFS